MEKKKTIFVQVGEAAEIVSPETMSPEILAQSDSTSQDTIKGQATSPGLTRRLVFYLFLD